MTDTHAQLGLATNCHHNDRMADWQRLGQHVTARRIELGYRRREDLTAAVEGVSLRTLGDIESGRRQGYHRNTLAVLEHALRWAPGSIAAILEGGQPQVIVSAPAETTTTTYTIPKAAAMSHPADVALIQIMRSPDLTDEQKARVVRALLEDQAKYAERRAAELIEQVRGEA